MKPHVGVSGPSCSLKKNSRELQGSRRRKEYRIQYSPPVNTIMGPRAKLYAGSPIAALGISVLSSQFPHPRAQHFKRVRWLLGPSCLNLLDPFSLCRFLLLLQFQPGRSAAVLEFRVIPVPSYNIEFIPAGIAIVS